MTKNCTCTSCEHGNPCPCACHDRRPSWKGIGAERKYDGIMSPTADPHNNKGFHKVECLCGIEGGCSHNNEGMEWEKELEAIRKMTAEAFEGQSWFLAWNERLIERIALFLSVAKQEGVEEGRREVLEASGELIGERPTNTLEDVAYAFRGYENLSEREKEHVRYRDNGLYIKMVEYAVKEKISRDLLNRFNNK